MSKFWQSHCCLSWEFLQIYSFFVDIFSKLPLSILSIDSHFPYFNGADFNRNTYSATLKVKKAAVDCRGYHNFGNDGYFNSAYNIYFILPSYYSSHINNSSCIVIKDERLGCYRCGDKNIDILFEHCKNRLILILTPSLFLVTRLPKAAVLNISKKILM